MVFEFELVREPVDIEAVNARLYNVVAELRKAKDSGAIYNIAVREMQTLTGCDRTVLYCFDEKGHGQVLAEERPNQCFASYLGLRFPASDVPAQARRMYEVNRVRIIPDADYTPSPLLTAQGPARDIDLSASVLRSVSPVHRQYMRNMGTACSMSVSILIDGKLWGLVSCHHHAPLYVPLRLRFACDFIMQIVASQIESHQKGMYLQRALEAKAIQNRLLGAMAAEASYMDGLTALPDQLLRFLKADGAAIVVGMGVRRFGVAPSEAQVLKLAEWARRSDQPDPFVTSHLSDLYKPAAQFAKIASGMVMITLSRMYNTHVLWFRKELVETVRWGGDPYKPAVPAMEKNDVRQVDPRHSFEEWLQIVRRQSSPWNREELEAVSELRSAMLEIVLKRTEELAEMAANLQIANEELEAFSYSVSHDLRAPFRHISGFSEMLRDEEASRMSDKGKHYLAHITDSAQFAGLLVDSLLDFSRIARTKIENVPVAMEELFDKEWDAVIYDEGRDRTVAYSRGPLPRVMGDPPLLRQVVRNLLSNAVKYTGQTERATVRVEATAEAQEFIFSVADNGVGFDQQYAGKLFGVFQRLHRLEDFEGTGIGLANVRRIVTRHGGRTWAEGSPGLGATFYFSMPATFPPEEGA